MLEICVTQERLKMGTNDIHKMTETVYKNLIDNFNTGIRQLLLTGKAYHKALQGVSTTARAYNDALAKLGSDARRCRGGTEEIGEALLSIAEAQKELQAKYEESTKALFTEVILPLEHKLDNEFKRVSTGHRKYHQGHKALATPYNKAFESLNKFRKKTRNKVVYDNEKEAQYVRAVEKCQERLDEFRIKELHAALLEERKCHCFLLNRVCAISGLNSSIHRKGADLYLPLPEWRQLCSNPGILHESAQQLLTVQPGEDYGPLNGGTSYLSSNGFLHRDTQSLGSPFRRSTSSHDVYRQSGRFDNARTLPSRPTNMPPAPPTERPQVQAVYDHVGSGDDQLSFKEGDLINLIGNKSDGWQYGHNTRTGRYGWFPLSFTQAGSNYGNESPELHRAFSPNQRVKSVGDLLESRSLSENMFVDNPDVPGDVRRPKSLYEGPYMQTAQAPQGHNLYQGLPPPPNNYPAPRLPHVSPADSDQVYQAIPVPIEDMKHLGNPQDDQFLHQSGKYNRRQSFHDKVRSSSPPLPPPPPPDQSHHAPVTSSQSRLSYHSTPSKSRMSPVPTHAPPAPPAPPTGPPPPPPPPPPPSMAPPTPNPNLSSVSVSQNATMHGNPGYGSPAHHHHSHPPAPPPAPPSGYRDSHHIEDNDGVHDSGLSPQNMFSSVSLRRTKTNDRSAPRI